MAKVLARSLQIDKGDTRLDQNLFVRIRCILCKETEMIAFLLGDVSRHFRLRRRLVECLALQPIDNQTFAVLEQRIGNINAPGTGTDDGLGELRPEINRVAHMSLAVSPASTSGWALHPTFDRMRINDLHKLASGSSTNSTRQIDLDARVFRFWEGEAHETRVWRSGQFGANAVLIQRDGVVSTLRHLARMTVTRTPTLAGAIRPSSHCLEFSRSWHGEQIAKVPVPSDSTHVCEAESLDGRVLIRIPWRIVTAGYCVRTQLHHAKGGSGPGEGLAFAECDAGAGPNQGIDSINGLGRLRMSDPQLRRHSTGQR